LLAVSVMHHFQQKDNVHQCHYCGVSLANGWKSNFSGHLHYKVTTCDNGHENQVTVLFDGSGHDNFIKEKNLELIIHFFRYDKPVL